MTLMLIGALVVVWPVLSVATAVIIWAMDHLHHNYSRLKVLAGNQTTQTKHPGISTPIKLAVYTLHLRCARALGAKKNDYRLHMAAVEISCCIAVLRKSQSDLSGALVACDEGLSIFRRLSPHVKSVYTYQCIFADILRLRGDIRKALSDGLGALTDYDEVLCLFRILAAKDGNDNRWPLYIAATLKVIGDLRKAQDDSAGALVAYEELLGIRRNLTLRHPNQINREVDLAWILTAIGDLRAKRGELPEALIAFEKALDIRGRLVANQDDNIAERIEKGICQLVIAQLHERLDERDRAGAEFQVASQTLAAVSDQTFNNARVVKASLAASQGKIRCLALPQTDE